MLANKFNPLRTAHQPEPRANSGTAHEAPETNPEGETPKPESEEEPEPEKTEPAPVTAPEAAVKPNAFQRGALRALGIGDLVARVEKAEAAEALSAAEVTRLAAENLRLTSEINKLQTEAPKQVAAAAKGRENEVSKQVTATLTNLGVNEAAAPSQVAAENTPEALLEKFNTLKGAGKTAFFRANKTALKAADASQASK
jgi:hypothetical protein